MEDRNLCRDCGKFWATVENQWCSVCAKEKHARNHESSASEKNCPFKPGSWVRLPQGRVARFEGIRPNDYAVVKSVRLEPVLLCRKKGTRSLFDWVSAGERPHFCEGDCECMYEVDHTKVSNLQAVDPNVGETESREALAKIFEARNTWWSDTTASTCPYRACTVCEALYCGRGDCQDGSSPSGGDWNVVCTSSQVCSPSRNCRFCSLIRKVCGYGGEPVCCKCKTGHPAK